MPSALDWNNPRVQHELGLADILIFQRNAISPEVYNAMDYWRALGRAVAVDLDDSYPQLPPSNPAFHYWIRNRTDLPVEPVEALREGLKHADALTSPSKTLLGDWADVVPGYWIPNYARRLWYEPLRQKPVGACDIIVAHNEKGEAVATQRPGSENWVILGWGGSISHVDSWVYSGIIEALDDLFEKWPNLRLKFCGHEARLDYLFNRWGDRLIRQDGVRPENWPSVVSTFDIGLAPLDLRPIEPFREGGPVASYDERRSWLKAVEYLCAGVPWVATQSRTYEALGRWGTLVENGKDAWYKALDHKITHLTAEKQLAWEKRRWAFKNLTAEARAGEIADIYGRIIAERMVKSGSRLPEVLYV